MKLFLKKIVLYVVPLLLLFASVEFVYKQIPSDYSYKRNYLEQNSSQIGVLIFGSSHSYFGINASLIDSAFSISNVSQGLEQDNLIFSLFRDSLSNLNSVIIPISYFSLFSDLSIGSESWRQYYYSNVFNEEGEDPFWDYLALTNFSMRSSVRRVLHFLFSNKNFVNCDQMGVCMRGTSPDVDFEKSGREAALRHTKSDWKYLESNLLVLIDVIEYSQQNDLNIFLVTTPTLPEYNDNLNMNQLAEMQKQIQLLRSKYDNVNYNSFLKDTSFIKNDFYDADHLNGRGAEKFTLILKKWIKACKDD